MTEEQIENDQILLCSNVRSKAFTQSLEGKLKQAFPETTQLKILRKEFPGGERYLRIMVNEQIALFGKDCIFVATLITDDDFMEFFRIAYTLASLGSRSRIFIIPYMSYSVMNENLAEGDVSHTKANAQLFSALSTYGLGNSFLFLDLHSQGFLHYLEGNSLHVELQSFNLLAEGIRQAGYIQDKVVFASADLGRPKIIDKFAKTFKASIAFVRKAAHTGNGEPTPMEVIGDVKGMNVVIYDDMIRSGKTILNAAEQLIKAGALSVKVVVSHLCSPDDVLLKIVHCPYISHLVCTNSHPSTNSPVVLENSPSFFTIVDVSDLFVDAIYRIFRPQYIPALSQTPSFFAQQFQPSSHLSSQGHFVGSFGQFGSTSMPHIHFPVSEHATLPLEGGIAAPAQAQAQAQAQAKTQAASGEGEQEMPSPEPEKIPSTFSWRGTPSPLDGMPSQKDNTVNASPSTVATQPPVSQEAGAPSSVPSILHVTSGSSQ
ncbi:ribose-phosphate diphosphokinase [Monocercomonoides exilis]|uniref:ribose-phosphate diphosphokinase n=1 Tax=Monocercomonoides exilis TaxID=2049356 RepID=UPI003559EBDB|nr:ribose-phosphate diphosphokinase [Monocercomonoides exilis]|eukprot:MONOS_10564.1-p1 / transcript=MONOS_10564.1 / gene=MONOS_10564 / organism=Monocercomonoides_exilis_PA203 / gene_product=ribose-phosphate diphosphokinase [EC:2.7.6.1] / transcript_product=ribose-phosphate diphosphokinase [EC:2.7.6.1] / location=Mono_scaffold00485:19625-21211(-) / protein_length=487 / sequence_SO=supercontig / SO=protein_coding / is_pseudo=false